MLCCDLSVEKTFFESALNFFVNKIYFYKYDTKDNKV